MASHEQRIADLERQVADLKRIVGGSEPPASASLNWPPGVREIEAAKVRHAYAAAVADQKAAQGLAAANLAGYAQGQSAQNAGNLCQAQSLNQCSANTPYAGAMVAPR